MRRIPLTPRADWQALARTAGFDFHSPDGTVYWREDVAYAFELAPLEKEVEDATAEIQGLLMQTVEHVLQRDELLDRFRIPVEHRGLVRDSWASGQKDLYTRLDLAWTGEGPAKLLEVNGDTPTALYEAAIFQWLWFEQLAEAGQLPGAAPDQLNSLHEALVWAFGHMDLGQGPLHLTCVRNHPEDEGTVRYLQETAEEAGLATAFLYVDEIGVDQQGRFLDQDDRPITALFKLYPWEDLLREEYAAHIARSGCRLIEPPWKMLLSNKAILPVLAELFPGHPNLLEAYFADDPRAAALGSDYVEKPLFGREGQGIRRIERGTETLSMPSERYGPEGHIRQALTTIASFPEGEGRVWAVIGSWIVAGKPCGIGIREGDTAITDDAARFVPHFITG